MRDILSFLTELHDNNNREWFEQNRERYRKVLAKHQANTERLIALIAQFDPTVDGATVANSTYRIYRDTRFSKDKCIILSTSIPATAIGRSPTAVRTEYLPPTSSGITKVS